LDTGAGNSDTGVATSETFAVNSETSAGNSEAVASNSETGADNNNCTCSGDARPFHFNYIPAFHTLQPPSHALIINIPIYTFDGLDAKFMHHLSLMLHRLMHKVRNAISIDEPEINRLNLSIDFTKCISAQNPLILLTPKNGPTHFEYTFDFFLSIT